MFVSCDRMNYNLGVSFPNPTTLWKYTIRKTQFFDIWKYTLRNMCDFLEVQGIETPKIVCLVL